MKGKASRAAIVGVAARVLVLLAAVTAGVGALTLAARSPVLAGAYACPMHPDVRAAAPGACPRCGMALVPVRAHTRRPPEPEALTTARSLIIARDIAGPAEAGPDGLRALLYPDDVALLRPGEVGRFHGGGTSEEARFVRVLGPAADPALVAVQFRVPRPQSRPRSGWLELDPRQGRAVVVPYRAVLRTAGGAHVLAVDGDRLVPRPVRVGRAFFGLVTVVEGLRDGDRIVGESAILYEAERRP